MEWDKVRRMRRRRKRKGEDLRTERGIVNVAVMCAKM